MKNKILKTLCLIILLTILFIPSTAFAAVTQTHWSISTNTYTTAATGTENSRIGYYLGPTTVYNRFYKTYFHQINDNNKKYLAYCLNPNKSTLNNGAGVINYISDGTTGPNQLLDNDGNVVNGDRLKLLQNIMAAGKQQGNFTSAEHFSASTVESEKRMYLATQILLWEVMSRGRVDYTINHLVGIPAGAKSSYDFVKSDDKLFTEYKNILEKAEELSDEGKPAGFGKQYILKWNDNKGQYISTGDIYVGSYLYKNNNKNVSVSIFNSKATISTTKEINDYTSLNFRYEIGISLDNKFKWFVFNAGNAYQKMLLAYYQGSNNADLSVKTEKGTFKLNKYDISTGAGLKGAVFTMYKCKSQTGGCTQVQKIDMTNKTISDEITITKSGYYKFVETTAPAGYEKLQDFFVYLTITDDGNVTAKIDEKYKNYIKYAGYNSTRWMHILAYNESKSFKISKIDGDDKKTKVKGATFQIKDKNGTVIKFKKLAEGSYEYSTSGTITNLVSANLNTYSVKGLPVGEYILEETAVPKPYELPYTTSERQTKFKIDKTDYLQTLNSSNKYQKSTNVTITVKNYKQKSFIISKLDGHDGKTPVKGATFQIKKSTGEVIKFIEESEGNFTYDPNGILTNLVSPNLSSYYITGLPVGKYILEEVAAPAGYILPTNVASRQTQFAIDKTDYLQILSPGNGYVKALDVTLTVLNYMSRVTIVKTASGKPVAGVLFELYDENKSQKISLVKVDGIFHYNGTATSSDLLTDSNGKLIISDLPEGTYYLKEVALPDGATSAIDPNNQWRKIVVNLGTSSKNIQVSFSNTKGDFCFYKMDEDGNYLDKGIFKLQVYNGNTSRYEDVTITKNSNNTFEIDSTGKGTYTFTPVSGGQTCFVNLNTRGKYKVVEIEAPEGFILPSSQSERESEVTINEQGYASNDAIIINKKITVGADAEAQAEFIVGISTGMDRINYVFIIGGIGLVIGILVFIKKKMDKK